MLFYFLQNFCWLFRGPGALTATTLRSLTEPTPDWGPALAENRIQQEHTGAASTQDSANILSQTEAAGIAEEVTSYDAIGDLYI